MGNFYSYRIICYIIFNRNSLLCELIVQKLHISLQQEEENRAICPEPVIRTFGISTRPYGASSGETEQGKNRNY